MTAIYPAPITEADHQNINEFFFGIADDIVAAMVEVSHGRLAKEGPAKLLDEGLSLAVGKWAKARDWSACDHSFVRQLMNEGTDMLKPFLEYAALSALFHACDKIFPPGFITLPSHEHPMQTFARFLNEVDEYKHLDPKYYLHLQPYKHSVVAMRRVGLALLPPETWSLSAPISLDAICGGKAPRWPSLL